MVDQLQPLHLFSDNRWQALVETFLNDPAPRGAYTAFTDRRSTLRQFFLGRNPNTVDRAMIDAFCSGSTIHGKASSNTVNRRRAALRAFYDLAIKEGLYQGSNPAAPIEEPRAPHLFDDERWQSCFVAWVEQLRSDDTRRCYVNILIRFFRDPGRSPALHTRAEVEGFILAEYASKSRHNHGEPVKPSAQTINLRLTALASFYGYSGDFQVMNDDGQLQPLLLTFPPTRGIKPQATGPSHRTMSEADIRALFAQMSPVDPRGIRDRAMFLAYLYLGRRNRELRLHWGDLQTFVFTNKDGSTYQGWRYRYKAKGRGDVWQYAEMPAHVHAQITWYLDCTGRLDNIQPDDGIFVRHITTPDGRTIGYGKEPLGSSVIRRILKKYVIAAGLDESICVHSFRHANAEWRARCGQSAFEIMHALGHTTLQVTTIYLSGLITENDPGASLLAARLGPLLEGM